MEPGSTLCPAPQEDIADTSPRGAPRCVPIIPPAQLSTEHLCTNATHELPADALSDSAPPSSLPIEHLAAKPLREDPAESPSPLNLTSPTQRTRSNSAHSKLADTAQPRITLTIEAEPSASIAARGNPDEAPSEPQVPITPSNPFPDRYYYVNPQEKLKDGRYETLYLIGMGRYSQVWSARDQL